MTEEKLKNKCKERAKIFQQAMESCKSSSPMDCIEWFTDRIAELEEENAELDCQKNRNKFCYSCANATEKCFKNEIGCPCDKYKSYKDENAELKGKQKWLGNSTKCWFSSSPCRSCDEHDERLKHLGLCYIGQLTKAKEIIRNLLFFLNKFYSDECPVCIDEAEQFISEVEK